MKRVLIVRLDAIGDYILWRNCLRFLRNCARYRNAHITVLGNPAWRGLAEAFDADCADEWIWAENRNALFRLPVENLLPHSVWHRRVIREQAKLRDSLRERGFDEVISPQAFSDPLLDELVSGMAEVTTGVANGDVSRKIVFSRLVESGNEEFVFLKNHSIAAGIAGEPCNATLRLDLPDPPATTNRILFFTGASHWTRRWPRRRWRALAQMLPADYEPLAAPMDGTLPGLARLIASCAAVVSNDTMALHLAAALGVPVVGIVNGVSGRGGFWPYPTSLGKRVTVVEAVTEFHATPTSAPSLLSFQLTMWRNLAAITPGKVVAVLLPLLNQDSTCG